MAAISAIQNRLTLTADELRRWAGIAANDTTVTDQELLDMAQGCKEWADHYCNNAFVDDEGENRPIPMSVKEAVKRLFRDLWDRRRPGQTGERLGDFEFAVDPSFVDEDVRRMLRPHLRIVGF